MRIFIRGNDSGNAALTALVLVMVLSSVLFGLVPRISATKRYAAAYKEKVLRGIEQTNMEIKNRYELY
jgi:type II secretory pathway component PulK